jgi:hypothetical protein
MPDLCLYAYTEQTGPEGYPGFVNLREREEDGALVLMVRQRGFNGEKIAELALTDNRLLELADQIYARLHKPKVVAVSAALLGDPPMRVPGMVKPGATFR